MLIIYAYEMNLLLNETGFVDISSKLVNIPLVNILMNFQRKVFCPVTGLSVMPLGFDSRCSSKI